MRRLTARIGGMLVAATLLSVPALVSGTTARANPSPSLLVQAGYAPPGHPGVVSLFWQLQWAAGAYGDASSVVYGQPGDVPPASGAGTVLASVGDTTVASVTLPAVPKATSWAFRVIETVGGVPYTGTAVLHRSHVVIHFDPKAKGNNTSVHFLLDNGSPAVDGSYSTSCGKQKSDPQPLNLYARGKVSWTSGAPPGRCTVYYNGATANADILGRTVIGAFPSSASYTVTVPFHFYVGDLSNFEVSPGQRTSWSELLSPGVKGEPVQIQLSSGGTWKTVLTVKAGKPDQYGRSPFAFSLVIPRSTRGEFRLRMLVVGHHGYLTSSQEQDSLVAG